MHVLLVGCGGIARDGYLPALAHLRPDKVTLLDPSPIAGQNAQTRLQNGGINATWIPTTFDIREPADAGVVAVPPNYLDGAVRELLQSSQRPRALLIEKPLSPSYQVASSLVQDVGSTMSLAYMETFLHSTAYDVLTDELASGRLGAVQKISLAFRGNTPENLDVAWRGDRSSGGGVLHDWGIHSFGLVVHLLGLTTTGCALLDVEVIDATWQTFGDRRVLTSCHLALSGNGIETDVMAAWGGSPSTAQSPDAIVECERGSLALLVRKTNGSSDWVCLEYTNDVTRELASRRYPKELFIRGLDGFLRQSQGKTASSGKFDVMLGVEALRLADAAYNQTVDR